MIDNDPEVFSSFWNISCPALPLTDLACLANGFPLIINLFPKTFLLLCKALLESPTDLFLSFDRQVRRNAGNRVDMNAAVCFHHFPGFARGKLRCLNDETDWLHLENVLLYECAAIEVAEFAKSEKPVNIDLCRLHDWHPRRPKNVIIETFDYDMPSIVADLKAGNYVRSYPKCPCHLAFRQQNSELEVTEVNAFGRDFVMHCSGTTTIKEIAAKLKPTYGTKMSDADFLTACQDAALELSQLELLAAIQPETPE